MIRKYALPVLAIIGFAVAILAAVRADRGARAQAQSGQQSGIPPFASYIFGPGIIEASSENIAVGTPVSGIVTALYVKWGDRVKSGAPLFQIDTRDLEAQLIPANAKVGEAESQLLLANAKIGEAKATLAKTENRLKVGEALEPGVSISAEDLANRKLDAGISQAAVTSAEAEFDQIKAQIASAQAQVKQIERDIELRTIHAPVAGRILQMNVRVGEFAPSAVVTMPLILLGDDTRLHLRVDVDETDAWRFHPCAPALATLRGNPGIKTPLQYVRTDPDVIPKTLFTGDTTQRTDARVLQVIYSFDPGSLSLYVGQLMDVFIDASRAASPSGNKQPPLPCRDSSNHLPNRTGDNGRRP